MHTLSLNLGHAAECARLHAGFKRPWTAAEFAALMRSPGCFGLGVEREGRLAGFILLRAAADEAEVLTLAVAEEHRRQGLGRELVAAGMQACKQRGAKQVFLEVAVDNHAAIALYETVGFTQAGRRPVYYGGQTDALVLRLTL